MAIYNLSAGDHGVNEKTLTANTPDTVLFVQDCDSVEIISDGAADLYVGVGQVGTIGTSLGTPVAASNLAYRLPAGAPSVRVITVPGGGATIVRLISTGTPKYSVTEAI
jgi:hypothetical protein